VQFDAPHNYNRDSREAVYAWMARWLNGASADVRVPERAFRVDSAPDLLVFYGRPLPSAARTRATLIEDWIRRARSQLVASNQAALQRALLHALALPPKPPAPEAARAASRTVLMAGEDAVLRAALARAGFTVLPVVATPFDNRAAAAIQHFDTYNRTAASQRVADIVSAARAHPHAALVAGQGWGLSAVLASAAADVDPVVADVERFDRGSDEAFVESLYIPGIRRAGDLQTAASLSPARIFVHNAAEGFALDGATVERRQLTPAEVVTLLRRRSVPSTRSSLR
jgi:hypothetical protein